MNIRNRLWLGLLLAASGVLSASCNSALAGGDPSPAGWILSGSAAPDYEIGDDVQIAHTGHSSGTLRSIAAQPHGFGTLMQTTSAADFRGKRVRMSAYVKAEAVKPWAGLWMRVDGPEKGKSLAFDNMQGRPIRGSTDWTRHEIVLDVAPEATNVAFGVLLEGPGQVWIDDMTFEIVDASVQTTDMVGRKSEIPKHPMNLDFEQ